MDYYRNVDVLVAGGGPSGTAACIAAARQGARTLIVERYGRLGGAAVTNCVQPFMGEVDSRMTDELLQRWAALLQRCDEATFAGGTQADGDSLRAEAVACLTALERQKL